MTHTFTKTPTPHHALDKDTVTVTIETDNLHETVRAFGDYLRACGFQFSDLQITEVPATVTHSILGTPVFLDFVRSNLDSSHETTD